MDTWHSPPSIGIDKRKEYVVSKLKEGFELRVSPNRVRLFKAGQGYIPCALPIYRRLLAENIIIESGTRAGDQVFVYNPEIKSKGGTQKKKPVIIDDDPLDEELTIEVPISMAELDAVDVDGADDLLEADEDEEEEDDLTDSFIDEEEDPIGSYDDEEDTQEEEGYEDDDVEV